MVALYDEYPRVISTQRTMRTGDWLFDRELEAQDELAYAAWEREQRIEKSVTWENLLEELSTSVSPEDGADFMDCLANPTRDNVSQMRVVLGNAKERIVARRMAETQAHLFSGD